MKLAVMKYLFHTSYRSLTSRKILRNGADGFNSTPKEGVLLILAPLEIDRSRIGLYMRTLGPMASTLTTDHRGRQRDTVTTLNTCKPT
jgi:hypothetical protein